LPTSAAQWFAVRRGRDDERNEQAFRQWLAQDPANAEEYALCDIAWAVSGDAARQPVIQPARTRGRALRLTAAAGVAAFFAGLSVWFWPAPWTDWSTTAGEQRTLVLEDGSRVTLNTRTHIEVRLARRHRDVRLLDGEAYFEVAKDPSRPFIVQTAVGSARAVGTQFNVYLTRSHLAVTTAEGRVLVNGTTGSGVLVDAGNQALLDQGASSTSVAAVNVSSALSWRAQRLEVDDMPLARVLQEFSRYTSLPVRAGSEAIGALRVSAVLRTGDLDALRATLKGAFGLTLQERGQEYLVLPSN
jgi:transmembrane sensor